MSRSRRRGGGREGALDPGRGERREWIGGRLSPPFFVGNREEAYRVELALWLELPSGVILAQQVYQAAQAHGALARALADALRRPQLGPPRRPDRIRVASASLAEEVRGTAGAGIEIVVAPTPELDDVLEDIMACMSENDGGSRGEEGYLASGRIPAQRIAELFRAAERLHRAAPWEVADDDQLLRIDIPALGVEGACLSIIGSLEENLGFLLFPSLAGFEAFLEGAEDLIDELPGVLPDLGTEILSLIFERGADLPPAMRREVATHGWPVAHPSAYPRVERRDRDGAPHPLVERDVRIATACATALVRFFARHRGLFEREEIDPIHESYTAEDGLEVRITVPCDAPLDSPALVAAEQGIGRNEPCPCGSGKKYKKCHLPIHEEARGLGPRDPIHALDERLVAQLLRFAQREFGWEWLRFEEDFADPELAEQLAIPWSVFGYRVQGETVAAHYLQRHGRRLSPAERSWFDAQCAAWLSVWEVVDVDPGRTIRLRDLLSHEERLVSEASGSRNIARRTAILARVADHDGRSFLCGAYAQPLPPLDAGEVVRRARARLRRRGAVPVERLRDDAFGRYLIQRWEKAIEDLGLRRAVGLDLRNTDGDAFLLTTDHLELEPGARAEVAARLAALEGVEADDDGEAATFVFLRPGNHLHSTWENTLLGRATLSERALRVESNSRERADALRARIEEACGERIRRRAREQADPLSSKAFRSVKERLESRDSPDLQQLALEFKERHYASWPDASLPALGGLSPRQAVRSARGREAVDTLLKDMEYREDRTPAGQRFDFSRLRAELGVE